MSDDGAEDERAPNPEPSATLKRRKKRRGAADSSASEEGAFAVDPTEGDADDDAPPKAARAPFPHGEAPAFARDFPRDPALDALVAAFEQGDYARVRREAPELAARAESSAVQRAARELRRRLDPDPLAVYLLALAALLLAVLAVWYWSHGHASM